MYQSALIVRVPESEIVVSQLRARYDESSQYGMPAHLTVLYPFISPDLITDNHLQGIKKVLEGFPAFNFTLSKVGRFPETTYLIPQPGERFIEMTKALYREYPEFPPFGGIHESIVPHLTVANGDKQNAKYVEKELSLLLENNDVITSLCNSVELVGNQTGNWQCLHVFHLL